MAWPIISKISISGNFERIENLGPRRKWVPRRPVDVAAAAAALFDDFVGGVSTAFVVGGGVVLGGGDGCGGGDGTAYRRGGVVIIVVVVCGGVVVVGIAAAITGGGGVQLPSGTGTPGTWKTFIITPITISIRRSDAGPWRRSRRRLRV
jgi:hypothetical protein